MLNVIDKVKGIKDTVVDKVSDKKNSLDNPLRDFTSNVIGEGHFPIKEYVDFDKAVDLRNIAIGVKENRSEDLLTVNLFQNHTLIAGSAGAGKSVIVKNIIGQIAKTNAVIYGFDFKKTELYVFKDRFAAIAQNQDEALSVLKDILREMNRRNTHLNSIGATKLSIDNPENPPIIVVIDELAELLCQQDSSKEAKARAEEIDKLLRSLAQLSRGVSISLVVSTQSPKSDIINTQLRNNFTNRIGLFTSTKTQLESVIGEVALEVELIKREERAGWFVGENGPVKFKPLWVSDKESKLVAHGAKDNKK